MRSYLQQVATGPELSKSISREAARDAMRMILEQQLGPVQAGIYLIALRMKRETDEENRGSLNALLEVVDRVVVECDHLIDIADPFNGYARGIPATPFLGPVLAACGLNAYSHGLLTVGPKFGVTHHMVFAAAGIPVDLSTAEAAERIADERIGWAYVDQSNYLPQLHQLIELRSQMVKRSCITTLEVLLGPLRAKGKTHLLTGYVHKNYPPVYSLLAREAGYDGAMIVRGVEGGCIPSLSQPARYFRYSDGCDDQEVRLTPAQVGIERSDRMIDIPLDLIKPTEVYLGSADSGIVSAVDARAVAAHCVELGKEALDGKPGAMLDSLIYASAICLLQSGHATDLQQGASQAREAIRAGTAMQRLVAAQR